MSQEEEKETQKIKSPKSVPKAKFTPVEDFMLRELVAIHGTNNWQLISVLMITKNARQCRDHWESALDPLINKCDWTEAEDKLLLEKHNELGNKWAAISKFFPGRPYHQLKSRITGLKRKALRREERIKQRAEKLRQKEEYERKYRRKKTDTTDLDETTLY